METMITGSHKTDKLFAEMAYNAYVHKNEKAKLLVKGALQAFVAQGIRNKEAIIQAHQAGIMRKEGIQAFGVSTDFTKLPRGAFDLTVDSLNFDMGFERAFKTVQADGEGLSWAIYTVSNGITFVKVPEGDRIEVKGMSGDHVTVDCDYYGGALGFTDRMIRSRQIAAMVDRAEAFRNKLYENKATNHYTLIRAAANAHVTAYQGVVGDGELRRDILTINQAAYNLTNRNKDKGYGDMANVTLYLYANPLAKNRVFAALSATTATLGAALGTGQTVNYTIVPIWTYNSAMPALNPILVLPGNKMQKAEVMAPTTYEAPADPLTLNKLYAVWTIYGAAIADDEQCETVSFT